MIDQDLLSCLLGLFVMRKMVSNELCPDSTPLFLLTKTVSDLSKSLRTISRLQQLCVSKENGVRATELRQTD
jgi:hypothetical protein